MRYYLIAGEASGDLHGSNLIRGLKTEDPDAEFRFWGGDLMSKACLADVRPRGGIDSGLSSLGSAHPAGTDTGLVRHYREGAVMGLTDVLAKAGKLLGNLSFCKKDILSWKPDVVILIDYPGFNLKIAEFCHSKGIKVFYYIAPKTWASRAGRNRKLKAWVDKLFIVFPFEIPYFTAQGIPFEYSGNPLLDAVDNHEYLRPEEGKYIAILAGSRKGEIGRMMPVCVEVMERLHSMPEYSGYRFVIAGAPARSEEDYRPYIKPGMEKYVKTVFGRTYDVLKFADAAVINSGTASLEAALIAVPQVVCWSASPVTVFVARHILKVANHIQFISLGNLCIGRSAFRELIQEDFTVDQVTEEVIRLLSDTEYRSGMLDSYSEIRRSLGESGASRSAAASMIGSLKGKQ